jgi:hypothetical protein
MHVAVRRVGQKYIVGRHAANPLGLVEIFLPIHTEDMIVAPDPLWL